MKYDKLNIGDKAPLFELESIDGNIKLESFRGSKVILYFYPKDNTPGCTTEAKDFTVLLPEFEKLNAIILGISKDSLKSHRNFTEKHNLKVMLLSDPEKSVMQNYGVWLLKKNYGREYMGVVRSTFLIDEKGKIINIWFNVKAKDHAAKVLEYLKNL